MCQPEADWRQVLGQGKQELPSEGLPICYTCKIPQFRIYTPSKVQASVCTLLFYCFIEKHCYMKYPQQKQKQNRNYLSATIWKSLIYKNCRNVLISVTIQIQEATSKSQIYTALEKLHNTILSVNLGFY